MTDKLFLGSLFDGIGAVPYAASFFDIKTTWASEILPRAISVSKRHFPDMEHLGDITELDGSKIQPVDNIAFGSPCQSWSVAGDRSGFDGKSGLFMQAIRIIREMRKETDGKYPQIALFENVTGLLNCRAGGRSDYQTVLEAFCETEIPMPKSGRWANAGMVRGRGIDLAWVVKDSQYHRTAQRRKRLFVIVDFTGQRAGEILFVSKSLSGYFAARECERERTAADIESGVRSAITVINDQGGNSLSIEKDELSPTLRSQTHGNLPIVCEPAVYAICSDKSNSMLSSNPNSGIYKAETSRTLDQNGGHPGCNQGGMLIVEPQIDLSVMEKHDISLCANCDKCVVAVPAEAVTMRLREGCAGGGKGPLIQIEKSGTLATANDQYLFCLNRLKEVYPDIVGTLCASGAGLSRPDGNANETDLCVTYGIQGNMIGGYSLNYQNPIRTGYIVRRLTPTEAERLMSLPDGWTQYGHDGRLMSDSARYQMCGNSIVVNCLAYIMQNIAGHLNGEKRTVEAEGAAR